MSIASELNNYRNGLDDAWDAAEDMGATIPHDRNMVNLDDAIRTIPVSSPNDGVLTITQNGTTVQTFSANQATNVTAALTDTTYSDFTGATSSAAGAHGLVPAPSAGDQDKFLKGDGTWGVGAATNNISSTDWDALWNGGGELTDFSLSMTDYESYDAYFYVSPNYDSNYVYDVGDYRLYVDGNYSGGYAEITIAPTPSGATVPTPTISVSMYDTSTTYTDYFTMSTSGNVITINTTGTQMIPMQYGMNYAILTIQCGSVTKTLQVRT